jgi:NAD(P)-dependent dehydrogenase (short-subunit alcohol dehydrogenase family)
MTKRSRPVLITGCSSGIGRATALRLLRSGLIVYATARDLDAIADLRAAGCRTLSVDVTDEDSMRSAVEAVEEGHGPVGALVNNAGYSLSGALETLPMAEVRRQFETNVFGLLRMCQLVLPGMRHVGWGRIVNISSMGGRLALPGGGAYHASKYAVEALSDTLRFEVSGFGVKVVLVEPGFIRSGFAATATAGMDPTAGPYGPFNDEVARVTVEAYDDGLLARLGGEPDDVAKAVERAVVRRNPPARLAVTPSARVLMGARRAMPDRVWDRFLTVRYRRPGED